MYDGYQRHDMITNECFIVLSEDQRHTWTRWKNLFPDHFKWVWIGTDIVEGPNDNDDNEYDQLLGHAVNLGFRDYGQVWLFCGPSATETNLYNFCYWAWKHRYLRRFERGYYEVWKCKYWGNPTGCDPDDPDDWYYDGFIYTGVKREVYP